MKPKIPSLILLGVVTQGACTSVPKTKESVDNAASTPKLLKPIVRKIWIPPEIRNGGTEWVEGHYLYRIERDTKWTR